VWLRGLIGWLLLFSGFWWVDVYQLEAGRPVRVQATLVRKSHSTFEFEDGVYDLSYSQKFGKDDGHDHLDFLWQGAGGGLTAMPPAVREYLDEMVKDRAAVRAAKVVDPESGDEMQLPALDYQIIHRLVRREHTEGWFGQHRLKAVQRLLLVAMIVAGAAIAGLVYVGTTPHVVTVCVGEPSGQIVPCVSTSTTVATTTLPNGQVTTVSVTSTSVSKTCAPGVISC